MTHLDDHTAMLAARSFAAMVEGMRPAERARFCTGPQYEHHVRSDNPMRTGRCECCRQLVAHTASGWQACTVRQAAAWGCLGARR